MRYKILYISLPSSAQGHPTTVFFRMILNAVLGYMEYF